MNIKQSILIICMLLSGNICLGMSLEDRKLELLKQWRIENEKKKERKLNLNKQPKHRTLNIPSTMNASQPTINQSGSIKRPLDAPAATELERPIKQQRTTFYTVAHQQPVFFTPALPEFNRSIIRPDESHRLILPEQYNQTPSNIPLTLDLLDEKLPEVCPF